jgi:hypothetical protein
VTDPGLAADRHLEWHAAAERPVGEGEALGEEAARTVAGMVGRRGHALGPSCSAPGLSITAWPRALAPIVTVTVAPGRTTRATLYALPWRPNGE